MKKNVVLTLLAALSSMAGHSQVMLSEDFTSPFNPNLAGWTIINNSIPSNTLSWMQGNGPGGTVKFSAYNGSTNDFYGADFRSVPQGTGGISSWLISPTLTIYNGAVLQFATRTATGSPVFPDRMQVRMSQNQLTAIPAGSASIGGFTDLLLDINPNLTINTGSVISNGTVNGYPQTWTVYNLPISGITGTVTGRIAFRYFVDDAGSSGINSRMIGLDAVRYTLPCSPVVDSYTLCPGNSATLMANGGLPSTTYQWSSGGTGIMEIVSPTVTTVYTLTPGNGIIPCGTQITSTVTLSSQLSVSISASSQTVCAGSPVILTAHSAATSYSWSNGGNFPIKTISPNSSANYTVSAANGSCTGSGTINIVVMPIPVLSYVIPYIRCPAATMSVSGFGASNYIWTSGTTATTNNPVSITNPSNAAGGSYTLGLKGFSADGCSQSVIVGIPYSASPNLSVTALGNIQCVNTTATIIAIGANTYTWTGDTTANSNTISLNNGAIPSIKTFSIAGTSTTTGCSAQTTYSYAVSLCTDLDETNVDYSDVKVFPNPFAHELIYSGAEGRIDLYNTIGQLVMSKTVENNEAINTSELLNGAYVIKIYSANTNPKVVRLLKH